MLPSTSYQKLSELKKYTNLFGTCVPFGLFSLSCLSYPKTKREEAGKTQKTRKFFDKTKKKKIKNFESAFAKELLENKDKNFSKVAQVNQVVDKNHIEIDKLDSKFIELLKIEFDPKNFKNLDEALLLYQRLFEDFLIVEHDLVLLKEFQKSLYFLREKFSQIRKIVDEIDTLTSQKSAKERILDLALNNLEAAKKNNWSLLSESLLYILTFKWLWGALSGYEFSSLFAQQTQSLQKASREVSSLKTRLNFRIKTLRKSLKLKLTELEKDFQKLKDQAFSFREIYRFSWGFDTILNIFEELDKAREFLSQASEDFEELVKSGILKKREAHHYLDEWAWNLSAAQEISFRFKKKLDRSLEFSIIKKGDLLESGDNRHNVCRGQETRMPETKDDSQCKDEHNIDHDSQEGNLCLLLDPRDGSWNFEGHNFLSNCTKAKEEWEKLRNPTADSTDNNSGSGSSSSRRGDQASLSNIISSSTDGNSAKELGPYMGPRISAGALSIRGTNDIIPFGFSSSLQPTWVVKPLTHLERSESWNAEARTFFSGDLQFAKQNYAATLNPFLSLFGPKNSQVNTPLNSLLSLEKKIHSLELISSEFQKKKLIIKNWISEKNSDKEIFDSLWKVKHKTSNSDFEKTLQEIKKTIWEFNLIREILNSSQKTKKAYDALVEIQHREKKSRDKLILTLIGVEEAKQKNWSKGKEIALYIFGLKWFWGIFNGYRPTSEVSKESEALWKSQREFQSLRETLSKEIKTLQTNFVSSFEKTLNLIRWAKKLLGTSKIIEVLETFAREFTHQFRTYDFVRSRHQNIYNLFTKELLQGRSSYFLQDDHSIKNEEDLFNLLPPLMISKSWKSKTSPLLNTDVSQWSTHDVVKKSEIYRKISKELVKTKATFDSFFREKQSKLIDFFVEEFETSYSKYKIAKIQKFLSKSPNLEKIDIKKLISSSPTLFELIRENSLSLEEFSPPNFSSKEEREASFEEIEEKEIANFFFEEESKQNSISEIANFESLYFKHLKSSFQK